MWRALQIMLVAGGYLNCSAMDAWPLLIKGRSNFLISIIIINKQSMKLMHLALCALCLTVAVSQAYAGAAGGANYGANPNSYQSILPTANPGSPVYPNQQAIVQSGSNAYPPITQVYQTVTVIPPSVPALSATAPTAVINPGIPAYPSSMNVVSASTGTGFIPVSRKMGLTLKASTWPNAGNNYAMRMSCNNCNPFVGDVLCSNVLPLLCIVSAKKLDRPFYNIAIQYTPFNVTDGGYYEGWTGGVFAMTQGVQGFQLTSYAVGNSMCQGYFGKQAKWADFNDGFYLEYMNQLPIKAWGTWNWKDAKSGAYNLWGYARTPYYGNAWVYTQAHTGGNCDSN